MSHQQPLFFPRFLIRYALEGVKNYTGSRPTEDSELVVHRPLSIAVLTTSPAYAAEAPVWQLLALEKILHAPDEEGLFQMLESQALDFLLLDQEYGKVRLLDKIKRLQPDVRFIFLLREPRPQPLLKTAMQGHDFLSLPYEDEARRIALAFLHKVFPRREHRCTPEGVSVEFQRDSADGPSCKRPLLDISNHGMAWLTESPDSARDFLPGTRLYNLRLFHGSELLASMAQAQIVHLSGYAPMPLRYRIGARFLEENHSGTETSLAKESLLHEAIDVAAILQRGLQQGGVRLAYPYDTGLLYQGSSAVARPTPGDTFQLQGDWPADWQAGGLVRGIVESSGWGYEFLSTVVERNDAGTLTLRTPAAMKGLNRRHTLRHAPSDSAGLSIDFIEPFSCRNIKGRPDDLTPQGFSIAFPAQDGSLPPGTRLPTILLHGIDARPIRFSGTVRWTHYWQEHNQRHLRCGIVIDNLADSDRLRLADALVSDKVSGVVSGQGMACGELFDFFRQSNFLYPKKEQALEPIWEDVQNTSALLIQNPVSPILRTLVIRSDDGTVDAHISLLRAYSQTWMSQHLTAMGIQKGNRYAGRDINIGVLNSTLQMEGFRWLRTFYQPQKSSPDLLLGNFVRRTMDRAKFGLNIYAFLTSNTCLRSELKQTYDIRQATPADLDMLERYFLHRDALPELLAEDVTADEMSLDGIGKEYQNYGLSRCREIVVAERQGRACGMALMEFSSSGINLSEIASRCTLHVWEEDESAAACLADYARTEYRKKSYALCTMLIRPELASCLVSIGFTHTRDYACSTVEREMIPEFIDYMEKMFGHHG
jgi:hypothetical protein